MFWYARETINGPEYMLVDGDKGTSNKLFDSSRLSSLLSETLKINILPRKLLLGNLLVSEDIESISFKAYGREWRYDLDEQYLEEIEPRSESDSTLVISPDRNWAALIRDYNIWIRKLSSGEEIQLTNDGEEFYAYAAKPVAVGRNPKARPELIWSPDSKRILTVQTDDRQVKSLPVIDYAPLDGSIRPRMIDVPTAFPGDEHVTRFRLTTINVETGKQITARYLHLPAVRMNDTPIGGNRAWWDDDSQRVWFVDIERGEKAAHVIALDSNTGEVNNIFSESTTDGYIELGTNVYLPTALVPIPEKDQLIWFSERSGWAHLYLYDLNSGEIVRQLTEGNWRVNEVLWFDKVRGDLFISINGRRKEVDPYYKEIARVNIKSGQFVLLSSASGTLEVANPGSFGTFVDAMIKGDEISSILGFSPTGDYYLETESRIDKPGTSVLRDRNGKLIMNIESVDTSQLPEDFTFPEPVMLTAADGKTKISAAVFRPSDFDVNRKYPVIDNIYGGPQISNVPRSVTDVDAVNAQAVAELGFIVVIIDGRGTSDRDRSFHEASYGAAHTASDLEDHISGLKQLASRYEYIDLERVGIFGFSGGGYMTANAMLRYPEFFDVGVAAAGNHDQRLFWHSWGERYQGPLIGDNYLPQANLSHAGNLKGKLMFIHGLLDHGVHPAGLFQLTQALMDKNKDFDLVLMPRAAHALPGYAMRKQWDYFVSHLTDQEPPVTPLFKSVTDHIAETVKTRAESLNGISLHNENSRKKGYREEQ